MMRYLPRPTYANVMATIAVFVALGGVSYAASDGSGPSSETWNGSTYRVSKTIGHNSPFAAPYLSAQGVFCDKGDRALGGGFSGLNPSIGTIESSIPIRSADEVPVQGWYVTYVNAQPSIPSGVTVTVRCANFK